MSHAITETLVGLHNVLHRYTQEQLWPLRVRGKMKGKNVISIHVLLPFIFLLYKNIIKNVVQRQTICITCRRGSNCRWCIRLDKTIMSGWL